MQTQTSFEDVVLPHLGAAQRLARALMRDPAEAEDAVQDASLRALRYFRTFSGGNGRAWFLRIVRNACFGRRGRHRAAPSDAFDEQCHADPRPARDPETLALHADHGRRIVEALDRLTPKSRRLLELRELHGLSYRELAQALDLPMGTVMSGLARARQALRFALGVRGDEEPAPSDGRRSPPGRMRAART